jgi:hypothetical protein
MIGQGMKVRFTPFFSVNAIDTKEEAARRMITGTIAYINWANKCFWIAFACGGTKQMECFKFSQIGKDVVVIG